MKKYIVIAALSMVSLSCNRQYNLAMKSTDKDFILGTANDFYAQKKWSKAIFLYDRLPNMVAGTKDASEVVYKSAYANFYDKNYRLAGHQFKNFANTFTRDTRREEAAYMSAVSYYEEAPDYNLDQSNIESSINYLQEFLNNYPNSDKTGDINKRIEVLTSKLEKKYYENAKQYFKMADYRGASSSFENLLEEYPGSQYKQQSMEYIMKSKFELGMHSIYELKKDRLESAIAYSREVEKEFPNTNTAKEATSMRIKLVRELGKHLELVREVETKKTEALEKQKGKEQN